jgi:secondary thiamine-phosphate synthase enzyme
VLLFIYFFKVLASPSEQQMKDEVATVSNFVFRLKLITLLRVKVMKSYTEYLWFNTAKKREYINITHECERILRESGIREGMMLVSAMHITAGIWVNDNEPGILQDADEMLERLAPYNPHYRHHATGEDNGDAHLKNLLMHHQVIIPITDGRLDLGPWQTIFYCEFDGRRRKRVVVKVIGE